MNAERVLANPLPELIVKLNRRALSRYGVSVGGVKALVEIAMVGKGAGLVSVTGISNFSGGCRRISRSAGPKS